MSSKLFLYEVMREMELPYVSGFWLRLPVLSLLLLSVLVVLLLFVVRVQTSVGVGRCNRILQATAALLLVSIGVGVNGLLSNAGSFVSFIDSLRKGCFI